MTVSNVFANNNVKKKMTFGSNDFITELFIWFPLKKKKSLDRTTDMVDDIFEKTGVKEYNAFPQTV